MSEIPTKPDRNRAIVVLLLVIASALKVAWALSSYGSLDVMIFSKFASHLQDHSLKYMYDTYPAFNHPPLTAGIIWFLGKVARMLFADQNDQYSCFAASLRFLSIIADAIVVLGLLHVKRLTNRPPWWAIKIFAISPVSLIVSGFHGNMDPVMVMFIFLAGLAVLHKRPALSGLLLALAFNIKVIPILFTPAFFFYWYAQGPRQVGAFTAATVGGFFAGAALPLIQCPVNYISHVLAYGSVCGVWGITYWLHTLNIDGFDKVDFRSLSFIQNCTMNILKLIIVCLATGLAWRRRKSTGVELFATLGMVWTLFFVFAPGAVVQYMPWYGPFVLLLAPRWWAALTAATTIFMVSYYHPASESHFPWVLAQPTPQQFSWSEPVSNLPWAIFTALFVVLARQAWREYRLEGTEPSRISAPAAEPILPVCEGT